MWKFKFRSQNLEKIANFVFQNFLISVFIVFTLVILGIQTLHYLSRVSVLALKISRYIVFITNRTFYSTCMSCLKLELSFIILVFSYGFLFIPFSFLEVCMWFCALLFQLFLLWVGWVLVFFLIRPLSRKVIETHIFDMKSCFLGCQYFITNWIRLDI